MGYLDRDYYRDAPPSPGWSNWGLYDLTPTVKQLIIVTVAIFVVQLVWVREPDPPSFPGMSRELEQQFEDAQDDPVAMRKLRKEHPDYFRNRIKYQVNRILVDRNRQSILQSWFELDPDKVMNGQVWRLVTHAFCHDRHSIWHILFNMLGLYWFGCTVEAMYGSREFLFFYLVSAVIGGLTYILLSLYSGLSVPAIGASGAVMAVMMLFTYHFPRSLISVFVISIEARWLMLLYLIWELHPVLLILSGEEINTGVAHAGHLGGLAFGFLYGKYHWRLEPLFTRVTSRLSRRRKNTSHLRLLTTEVIEAPEMPELGRVDQILEKISEHGQASLTAEERAVLKRASEKLKRIDPEQSR